LAPVWHEKHKNYSKKGQEWEGVKPKGGVTTNPSGQSTMTGMAQKKAPRKITLKKRVPHEERGFRIASYIRSSKEKKYQHLDDQGG